MSTAKTALIIGATGQTGGCLLKELISSPHYSKVYEYGRRLSTEKSDKLVQKTINFDEIGKLGGAFGDEEKSKWDVVFITLGTTKANAGSAEAFERIDREYVLRAAREAKSEDPALKQRIVYCSSGGANSNSPLLYSKSKGLTEEGLASLGYSDSIFFQPGLLVGTARPEKRTAEQLAGVFTGLLSRFSDSLEIKVATLGKAMANAGWLGSEKLPERVKTTKAYDGKATLIGNGASLKLAATEA
ncbi:nucleoside-diphosphate-sugar epimerase [Moniliophthora roreri MCA 2997]|uniref:Nucleoside-diphosphate-sugar epimerase n=1 Tax=Moniliophthora roreri (strain MCA 2997) TaxID=1381753 RepID=V2WTM5_MONRO|nr:nucleoside-diphosphate-sugar epimerase [Moniliophthora roreri MCA 2997]